MKSRQQQDAKRALPPSREMVESYQREFKRLADFLSREFDFPHEGFAVDKALDLLKRYKRLPDFKGWQPILYEPNGEISAYITPTGRIFQADTKSRFGEQVHIIKKALARYKASNKVVAAFESKSFSSACRKIGLSEKQTTELTRLIVRTLEGKHE